MPRLITHLDQVTPDWLTSVLHRAGCLPRGRVRGLVSRGQPTTTSQVVWLQVDYSDDALTSAPARLLLKITRPGFHPRFGEQEVAFYTQVARVMPEPPTPACYDAVHDADRQSAHLLFEDLSATHAEVNSRPAPPRETCLQVVTCLARFHAFWWDHPSLGREVGSPPGVPDGAEIERDSEAFLAYLGDQLSPEGQRVHRLVAATAEARVRRRYTTGRNLTLIHGDAHFANFLVPRTGDRTRIIDWQFWCTSAGPSDLAFMIARNWTREQRHALELDLLRAYHDELLRNGVQGYSWEECWTDYREWAIENVLITMWQWGGNLTRETDWTGLRQALDAYEDLACEEVL